MIDFNDEKIGFSFRLVAGKGAKGRRPFECVVERNNVEPFLLGADQIRSRISVGAAQVEIKIFRNSLRIGAIVRIEEKGIEIGVPVAIDPTTGKMNDAVRLSVPRRGRTDVRLEIFKERNVHLRGKMETTGRDGLITCGFKIVEISFRNSCQFVNFVSRTGQTDIVRKTQAGGNNPFELFVDRELVRDECAIGLDTENPMQRLFQKGGESRYAERCEGRGFRVAAV